MQYEKTQLIYQVVLSLPKRDGNSVIQLGTALNDPVLSLPKRDGNGVSSFSSVSSSISF